MSDNLDQLWIDAEVPEGGSTLSPGKHEALITEAGLQENEYGKSLFYKLSFVSSGAERTKFTGLSGRDIEASRKAMGRAKRELKTILLDSALSAKSLDELGLIVAKNAPGLRVLVDVVPKTTGKGHYFNFMKVTGRDRVMTEANAVFGGFDDSEPDDLLID